MFRVEFSAFLFDKPILWVYVQLMRYDIRIYVRHVLMRPCKDVIIPLQKGFEVFLHIFAKQGSNFDGLAGVCQVYLDWN